MLYPNHSAKEFAMAIVATQPGKAPGPDGSRISHYRTFQTTLMPHFLEAFNAITDGHSTPSELLSPKISVIRNQAKTHYNVPATAPSRF